LHTCRPGSGRPPYSFLFFFVYCSLFKSEARTTIRFIPSCQLRITTCDLLKRTLSRIVRSRWRHCIRLITKILNRQTLLDDILHVIFVRNSRKSTLFTFLDRAARKHTQAPSQILPGLCSYKVDAAKFACQDEKFWFRA